MSRRPKYSHSLTTLTNSLSYFEKHELCVLITDELWQCEIYIYLDIQIQVKIASFNCSQK